MRSEQTKSKDVMDDMNDYQVSRWLALFEAVNIIADKVEKAGGCLSYTHMKQPALEHYVDSTSGDIYKALTGKEIR